MSIEGLLNRGVLPVLQQVLSFTEARHEVLANNVSNFDTVGYKAKDLPTDEFFGQLTNAVEQRKQRGAGAELQMKATSHLRWDRQGTLHAEAVEIEDNNILFHDQNNRFVEKQLSQMSQNALLHNVTVEMLRVKYNGLTTAIQGRM